MNQKYYIIKDRKKVGPLTAEQINEEQLFEDSLIWFEGLDNWKKCSEVKEEIPSLKLISQPPPTPDEIWRKKLNKAATQALKESSVFMIFIAPTVFFFSGGFKEDHEIRSDFLGVYADVNTIRYVYMPTFSILLSAVICSIIFFVIYRVILNDLKKGRRSI